MKRFGSIVATVLIAALVLAVPVTAFAGGKTHEMTAEVVSVDAKANMITIKDEKGESHTAPLLGAAIKEAKNFKAGDKVVCTCQDSEKGDHEGVTAIKKAATKA
jgi:Cu/Ag efflux protein CusF